ncbi:hypothetical protein TIFTF001_015782 [Ficus carica]|uniref:Uncharacterized protein n=1 Tax=Ficus carica TaxID=3494 RepID=A0AA88ASM7_FICCA|nr:hypothetical protein TIFTF001_015782 [Ficus carica]
MPTMDHHPCPADVESPYPPTRSRPTRNLGPQSPPPSRALMTSPSFSEARDPGNGPPPTTSSPRQASHPLARSRPTRNPGHLRRTTL